ncbi:hypothetical protein NHX12_031221, partial [Muraenolepis orangiensis]
MSMHDDTPERLDADFDRYLADMKPYVLKHPNRTERQRCAMWIRKLCDPTMCGSGPVGLKNRNMYARLLVHMLRRGVLDAPFASQPDQGCLKTLPTYMSIYFDEPLSAGRSSAQDVAAPLPDWVAGELGRHGDDTWGSSSSPKDRTRRRRLFEEEKAPCRSRMASSPLDHSPRGEADMIEDPRYLRERPILQPSPVEMKIKVSEAKHQEEKLRMQQRHDTDVQK